jgi:hypothetical protein
VEKIFIGVIAGKTFDEAPVLYLANNFGKFHNLPAFPLCKDSAGLLKGVKQHSSKENLYQEAQPSLGVELHSQGF